MVRTYTLVYPGHNLTCSPASHWDALELKPFAQGYPLAFTLALSERRSLMHHLNHLYSIVLFFTSGGIYNVQLKEKGIKIDGEKLSH